MNFKQILLFVALYSGGVNLFAQTELTGSVVDQYGTPISGARVSIQNTSASTETNFDGSFSMSTLQRVNKISISAPGRATRVKKYKPGKKYVLRNSSFWYQPNDGWRPFAMLEFAVPAMKPMDCAPFGIMVGTFIKKFGFYGRAILSKKVKTEEGLVYDTREIPSLNCTGEYKADYRQYGCGLIFCPNTCISLYAGASFVQRTFAIEVGDGKWYKIDRDNSWDQRTREIAAFDFGLMFTYKHFIANMGASIYCNDPVKLIGSFGVGYIF